MEPPVYDNSFFLISQLLPGILALVALVLIFRKAVPLSKTVTTYGTSRSLTPVLPPLQPLPPPLAAPLSEDSDEDDSIDAIRDRADAWRQRPRATGRRAAADREILLLTTEILARRRSRQGR
jgi:hypothetical protein